MPKSHNHHRSRVSAFTFTMVAALCVAPAFAGIQVEVRGVEENIRTNVLIFLSFERFKNSDNLSQDFVDRLQERSEREVRLAMRPFGFYEPLVNTEVRRTSPTEQNWQVIVTI